MSQAAEAFIRGARELPVMPPIAADVLRRAEDPESDPAGDRAADLARRVAGGAHAQDRQLVVLLHAARDRDAAAGDVLLGPWAEFGAEFLDAYEAEKAVFG